MKPEELMIGDWVYSLIDIDGKTVKKPQRITGIQSDGEYIQTDATDVWYHISTFEPIPILLPNILTHNNVLEQNDFEFSGVISGPDGNIVIYVFKKDNVVHAQIRFHNNGITFEIENLANKFYNKYDIQYIHQLQQIMRICGINKEIQV